MEYRPSTSLMTPRLVVPCTLTVAPMMGSPLESVNKPLMRCFSLLYGFNTVGFVSSAGA